MGSITSVKCWHHLLHFQFPCHVVRCPSTFWFSLPGIKVWHLALTSLVCAFKVSCSDMIVALSFGVQCTLDSVDGCITHGQVKEYSDFPLVSCFCQSSQTVIHLWYNPEFLECHWASPLPGDNWFHVVDDSVWGPRPHDMPSILMELLHALVQCKSTSVGFTDG